MKGMIRGILSAALVLLPVASASLAWAGDEHGHGAHWGYEGKSGPDQWGDLDPKFEMCKKGKKQSPVDISQTTEKPLKPIKFNYKETALKTLNNGHTIQVNCDKGSSIKIDGKDYDLLQFHFHSPSEHTEGGAPYDMEAHLVHKNSEDQLAVVGVFMEEGEKNALIQTIWDNLPDGVGKEKPVKGVKIKPEKLLPEDGSYYHYEGSLTTPPCSEAVNWSVMTTPIEVSKEQIDKFVKIIGKNARPVQPLNAREIAETESD